MNKPHSFIYAWVTQKILIVCSLLFLAGCEKANIPNNGEDSPGTEIQNGRKVKVNITTIDDLTDLKQVCTRISYCVFSNNGKLYSIRHQGITDKDFGSPTLTIEDGQYHLVIIAHNGLGNISVESEEKIKFKDNKITDTFAYSTNIDVESDKTISVELERIVANIRVTIPDPIPKEVKQMEFYYTGGSSTYSSLSGYGSVNSRQTEYRNVTDDMIGKNSEFNIYTFPRDENGEVKLTIKALDKDKSTVKSIQYEDVPISKNTCIIINSTLFKGDNTGGGNDDNINVKPDIHIPINSSNITDITNCY